MQPICLELISDTTDSHIIRDGRGVSLSTDGATAPQHRVQFSGDIFELKLAATLRWFTAGGAIRIVV